MTRSRSSPPCRPRPGAWLVTPTRARHTSGRKHDTPLDARFVRGYFTTDYLASFYTADATAVSLAWAERPALALCAEAARDNTRVIPAFRRVHVAAILTNLARLLLIVGMLIAMSVQERVAP